MQVYTEKHVVTLQQLQLKGVFKQIIINNDQVKIQVIINNGNVEMRFTKPNDESRIMRRFSVKEAKIEDKSLFIDTKDGNHFSLTIHREDINILQKILSYIDGTARPGQPAQNDQSKNPNQVIPIIGAQDGIFSPYPVISNQQKYPINNLPPYLQPSLNPPPYINPQLPSIYSPTVPIGGNQLSIPQKPSITPPPKPVNKNILERLSLPERNIVIQEAHPYTMQQPSAYYSSILFEIEKKDLSVQIKKRWDDRMNKKVIVRKYLLEQRPVIQNIPQSNIQYPYMQQQVPYIQQGPVVGYGRPYNTDPITFNAVPSTGTQPPYMSISQKPPYSQPGGIYNQPINKSQGSLHPRIQQYSEYYRDHFFRELVDKNKVQNCMDALNSALQMGLDESKIIPLIIRENGNYEVAVQRYYN
ncbi:MAG: hypothetical protein EZS28_000784 [Streblomastix strix]|uniref:Uncharacterized protein n=1 Tax=Streblomastix strix TaxID=222440 RepID=A0A5J4X8X2_9EUKA|nr:MAG: hypothetical protein EZS28_000784 [Streblomastix strix]